MRDAFEVERGDEFMSLVYALDAEAEGSERGAATSARMELEWMSSMVAHASTSIESPVVPQAPLDPPRPHTALQPPRPLKPLRPQPQPTPAANVRPPQRPIRPHVPVRHVPAGVGTSHLQVASPRPTNGASSSLTDDLTGIGGALALRRDVMLESSLPSPGGPRFALISVDVHPVAEVRERRGDAVADQFLKTLVEAIRASLRNSDSIYRSGPDELTLLLRGRDPGCGEEARNDLEGALRGALSERGLPLVRLATATKSSRAATPPHQVATI